MLHVSDLFGVVNIGRKMRGSFGNIVVRETRRNGKNVARFPEYPEVVAVDANICGKIPGSCRELMAKSTRVGKDFIPFAMLL